MLFAAGVAASIGGYCAAKSTYEDGKLEGHETAYKRLRAQNTFSWIVGVGGTVSALGGAIVFGTSF